MSTFDLNPAFLESPHGRIFVVHRAPSSQLASLGVLIIPPFAEELNRCRRMMTLLSEGLALGGCHVMTPDLYGTGDSEGEFGNASWQGWLEQLEFCVDQLRQTDGINGYAIVALRAGALLATDLIRQVACKPLSQVWWQPPTDGSTYLTQFLRLRLAADMLVAGEAQQSVQDLKSALSRGETLEVAGYTLSPTLSDGLAAASLKSQGSEGVPHTLWLDCTGNREQEIPPAKRALIAELCQLGGEVSYQSCPGAPFWNSVEIVENRQFIEQSCRFIFGSTGR